MIYGVNAGTKRSRSRSHSGDDDRPRSKRRAGERIELRMIIRARVRSLCILIYSCHDVLLVILMYMYW